MRFDVRRFALLVLCALAVSTEAAEQQIRNRISQIEKETGSRIGLIAIDAENGATAGE